MLQDELRPVGAGDKELRGVANTEKRLWRSALCAPCLTGRAAELCDEAGGGETPPNAMAGRTHMPSSATVLPPNVSSLSFVLPVRRRKGVARLLLSVVAQH